MKILQRSTMLILASCVASAAVPASGQVNHAATLDVEKADFVKEWADLVERYQPSDARGEQSPNAWEPLIKAITVVDACDERVWKAANGVPPDYTLIFSKRAEEKPGDDVAQERACAIRMLEEVEKSGFDEALDQAAGRLRAARPRLDSKERAAELAAMGIKDAEDFSGRLVHALLPELGKVRQLTRLNLARMHQAAAQGDWSRVVRCAEQNLAMARIVAHQPTMIDRLVGVAVVSDTLKHVRWHIMEFKPPAAALEAIALAMDRQLQFPPITLQCEGEQLVALDGCNWTFTGSGPKALVAPKALAQAQGIVGNQPLRLAPDQANRGDSVSLLSEYYAIVMKGATLPRRSRTALSFEQHKFEEERITERFAVVRVFLSATAKAMNANDQLDLEIAATRAMISIERSHRATGQFPATLAQATAGNAMEAMADPWNTSGPVMYKLLREPDTFGRSYLIYSVGVDGADDNGKELDGQNRYAALHKPLTIGADFIVNSPRD